MKGRKMILKQVLIVALVVLVAGCAKPVKHNTASGKAEVFFPTQNIQAVKRTVVSVFINRGYMITQDSDFQLAFDRPVQNTFAAAFLGSRYDSKPNARVTTTFIAGNRNTRVIVDASIITNPGSAFEKRTSLNNNADTLKIKAELETAARKVQF